VPAPTPGLTITDILFCIVAGLTHNALLVNITFTISVLTVKAVVVNVVAADGP
jgi:hypothetical protein